MPIYSIALLMQLAKQLVNYVESKSVSKLEHAILDAIRRRCNYLFYARRIYIGSALTWL